MNKHYNSIWSEVAWRTYELLPAVVDDVLKWRLPYLFLFKNVRVPIAILCGPTLINGRQGKLLIAGTKHRVGHLIRRFFESEPKQDMVGTVPLWNLAGTLKRLRTSADLTIACLDRFSTRLFFSGGYLAIPESVGSCLAPPEDINNLGEVSHKLKRELQRVFRSNFTHKLSREETDFERFYYTMHVPFTRKRFKEYGEIHNFYQLRRVFHQGGLILLQLGSQYVAGLLFQEKNQRVRSIVFGTINGEWEPVEAGAFAALYFFLVKHAIENGYKLVDLGGCLPFLNDGVLRYKRKWGANLIEHYNNYHDFLVYWNCFNESVTSFLSSTPLIFRDHGGLSALYVIDCDKPATQVEAWKVYHSSWISGLQRLYLIATSGWETEQNSPPQTTLVGPTNVAEWPPRIVKT